MLHLVFGKDAPLFRGIFPHLFYYEISLKAMFGREDKLWRDIFCIVEDIGYSMELAFF